MRRGEPGGGAFGSDRAAASTPLAPRERTRTLRLTAHGAAGSWSEARLAIARGAHAAATAGVIGRYGVGARVGWVCADAARAGVAFEEPWYGLVEKPWTEGSATARRRCWSSSPPCWPANARCVALRFKRRSGNRSPRSRSDEASPTAAISGRTAPPPARALAAREHASALRLTLNGVA
jgi:hypothetical protein